MPTSLVVLLAAGALVALCAPWLLMRQREPGGAAWRAARAHLGASMLVAAAVLCAWQGWSLADRMANLGALWLAWIASGFVALLPFSLRPRLLGAGAGILCACVWLLASLWLVLTLLFDGNSTAEADLGDGLHCRQSMYGFVTGDSGTDVALFRRYAFIDHDVLKLRQSDVYPESVQPAPAAWHGALQRCHRLIDQQRRKDAGTGTGAP
ncbi:hypothetical protein HH212_21150 [Massilia forsythiae]|uniref:Uncharacterized protein n=1 Tax=Massilia forsythiae TaxID=2728020 RepID=A0A7Z2ZVK9_9BURK|nr:hypothetical protein [Massilia forsythiae]QJE02217.1 hypothetical protein HH212_21150 [Massilia forsythiae]